MFDAHIVIENVKFSIQTGAKMGGYTSKKSGSFITSGLDEYFITYIDDLIATHGEIAVGSALKHVESLFDFSRPDLYYPTRDDSEMHQYQEDERQRFIYHMEAFLEEALRNLEPEDEELDEKDAEEYNRRRRNALERKRYWEKKGYQLPELPDLIEIGKRFYADWVNLDEYINMLK